MKVVVLNHMSLDGVIQSPARLDQDTRGEFSHGAGPACTARPHPLRHRGPAVAP